jgi:hypothetical protein
MKEIVLTNFASCFPDVDSVNALGYPEKFLFTPYVSAYELEGKTYKEFYWKCNTCNERATQDNHMGPIPEVVLSCKCRSNYSYGLDFAGELAAAAEQVPLTDLTE